MDDRFKLIIGGLTVAFVFVGVGAAVLGFANETLDVIARLFGAQEWELWLPPLPGYEIPGLEGNPAATLLLGISFTGLVLVVTFGVMRLMARRPQAQGKPTAGESRPSS
jgi:hypothetical protein